MDAAQEELEKSYTAVAEAEEVLKEAEEAQAAAEEKRMNKHNDYNKCNRAQQSSRKVSNKMI